MDAIGRRTVLAALGLAAAIGPAGAAPRTPARGRCTGRLFSSIQDGRSVNGLAQVATTGRLDTAVPTRLAPLPDRGHATVVAPDGRVAVHLARRPGSFAVVFDVQSGRILREATTPDDRHLYGHGVFLNGGRLFATTENAFDLGVGRIGLYDLADGFRRVGEWDSHGIGPHQLVTTARRDLIVVAHGGIRTHPDTGRAKLNLPDMSPTVSVLDARDGTLVQDARLPETFRSLSLRHLAIRPDGLMVIAGQWEGPESETPPLLAVGRPGTGLRPVAAPEPIAFRMMNYCGSVAFDSTGDMFAVTAPRGDIATFWRADPVPVFAGSLQMADVCGVAADGSPGGFYLSAGTGMLVRHNVTRDDTLTILPADRNRRWDNHLSDVFLAGEP